MAEYVAYPLMMFVATPFFLFQLGKEQYGQWMLLLAFNGIGGVAGLGMGTAAVKEVSAHRGRGDLAGAALAVRACFAVTLASSILVGAAIVVGAYFVGASWLSKVGEPGVVQRLVGFAAALITLEQIDTVFAGAIRGMERFDIAAKIEIVAKFAIVAVSALAAWLWRDLAGVIWCVLAATVARASVKAVIASSLLRAGALTPAWNKSYVAEAVRFGKWTWLQSMGSALFSTADRLLVGALLGAAPLAEYSVCLQLAQQVHTVPSAGAGFLFPLVSRRMASGQRISRIAIGATIAFGLAAVCLALPLILFGHAILALWIGAGFADQSSGTLAWLAVAFVILAFNVGPHFLLLGSNTARFVAINSVAAGGVALATGIYLVPHLGVAGAVFMRVTYSLLICTSIFAMISVLAGRDKHLLHEVPR